MQPEQTFEYWRGPLPLRKAAPLDLSRERAELAKQQTVGVRLKNAITSGEFVKASDVTKALELLLGVHREIIMGMPGKVADEICGYCPDADRPRIYRTLMAECRTLLTDLSAKEELEIAMKKRAAELRAVHGADADADEYGDGSADFGVDPAPDRGVTR